MIMGYTKEPQDMKKREPLLSMSQGPRMYPIHADKPSPRYRAGAGTYSCIMSYEFPRFRDITEYSTNAMCFFHENRTAILRSGILGPKADAAKAGNTCCKDTVFY